MKLGDYVSNMAAGIKEGAGDITRDAIAGGQNGYNQVLTAHATIGAPDGPPGTMEQVEYEMERDEPPSALETDPEPPESDIDMIPY